jgi:hypothetical protein
MFSHWMIAEQLVADRRNQLLADAATHRLAAASFQRRPKPWRGRLRRSASIPDLPRTHRDPATANVPTPQLCMRRRVARPAPCTNQPDPHAQQPGHPLERGATR